MCYRYTNPLSATVVLYPIISKCQEIFFRIPVNLLTEIFSCRRPCLRLPHGGETTAPRLLFALWANRIVSKNRIIRIVGGDAHIAPAVSLADNGKVRRNRNHLQGPMWASAPTKGFFDSLRFALCGNSFFGDNRTRLPICPLGKSHRLSLCGNFFIGDNRTRLHFLSHWRKKIMVSMRSSPHRARLHRSLAFRWVRVLLLHNQKTQGTLWVPCVFWWRQQDSNL